MLIILLRLDFRLPPQYRSNPHSSGTLRSIYWVLATFRDNLSSHL